MGSDSLNNIIARKEEEANEKDGEIDSLRKKVSQQIPPVGTASSCAAVQKMRN